jgi:hypothetical protein
MSLRIAALAALLALTAAAPASAAGVTFYSPPLYYAPYPIPGVYAAPAGYAFAAYPVYPGPVVGPVAYSASYYPGYYNTFRPAYPVEVYYGPASLYPGYGYDGFGTPLPWNGYYSYSPVPVPYYYGPRPAW